MHLHMPLLASSVHYLYNALRNIIIIIIIIIRSTKTKLKPVHVLGNIYFLMSPYDLDELCEWVSNFFFSDKDFTVDGLLEYGKQCSSINISSEVLEIIKEEHSNNINY